jgi:hypothetical protein
MRNIGSVRLQLFMGRELIAQFDATQESRELSEDERSLRSDLKRQSLGLASLARTIARHRSRIRFLEEGTRTRNSSIYKHAIGTVRTIFPLSTMRDSGSRPRRPRRI